MVNRFHPNRSMWRQIVAPMLALLAFGAALTGCSSGGYQLQGKVIEGDISFIAVVNSDDPRLEEQGVSGVSVTLVSDPNKLNRETLGEAISQVDGSFSIGVGLVGAGFFQYDAGVNASRDGYERASSQFNLPPSGKRVLIMMRKGYNSQGMSDNDPWQDYEKFK